MPTPTSARGRPRGSFLNETEDLSAARAEPQAATAYVPPSGAPWPLARPAPLGFPSPSWCWLGAPLLTVQWLRTRAMLQVNVAEIARDVTALKDQTAGLDARIAALEKSYAETQAVGTQFAELTMRLGALEADVSRAADRDINLPTAASARATGKHKPERNVQDSRRYSRALIWRVQEGPHL